MRQIHQGKIQYEKQTEIIIFQGRKVTLENLTPIFSPEQREAKRMELEQRLYEVFCKYVRKPVS